MRRSPKVSEVLPLLYLRGLSTGDFVPALSAFFGSETGLSASAVSRLTEAWRGSMTAGSAAVGMMIKPGPIQIITPVHPSVLLEVAQPPFQPLRRRARSLPRATAASRKRDSLTTSPGVQRRQLHGTVHQAPPSCSAALAIASGHAIADTPQSPRARAQPLPRSNRRAEYVGGLKEKPQIPTAQGG